MLLPQNMLEVCKSTLCFLAYSTITTVFRDLGADFPVVQLKYPGSTFTEELGFLNCMTELND